MIYAGRVVALGPADAVVAASLHPYAGALSAAFPRIGDPASRFAPAGLPGDPPDPRDVTEGCSFAPRCPRADDRCTSQDPPLEEHRAGHLAACLRIGEP